MLLIAMDTALCICWRHADQLLKLSGTLFLLLIISEDASLNWSIAFPSGGGDVGFFKRLEIDANLPMSRLVVSREIESMNP